MNKREVYRTAGKPKSKKDVTMIRKLVARTNYFPKISEGEKRKNTDKMFCGKIKQSMFGKFKNMKLE